MGNRPNADIAYGVMFEEGYPFAWEEDGGLDDVEDYWYRHHGVRAYDEYRDYGEYKAAKNAVLKRHGRCPVVACPEGRRYDDPHRTLIGLRTGHLSGDWDGPTEVSVLEIDDEHRNTLRRFIEEHCQPVGEYAEYAVVPDFKPRWLMVCSYG